MDEYITQQYKGEADKISEDLKQVLDEFIKKDMPCLGTLHLKKRRLKKIKTIIIAGQNDEYNVSKTAAFNIELLTGTNCFALNLAELCNTRVVLSPSVMVIILSQNGEGQIANAVALRLKQQGTLTIAVTQNAESELAKNCKNRIITDCNDSICRFCKEYLVLALLGVYIGYKSKNIPRLTVSVTSKIAQMLSGSTVLSSRSRHELTGAVEVINRYSGIVVCGYGADEGVADEVASALRKICSKRAFSLPLCQADGSLNALGDILLIAIISSNADLEIINHRLSHLRQSGIDTLIFTTEGISSELCIDDGIVTVSDSIALFNPVTLASSVYQTAVLDAQNDTKNDLSA